MQLTIDVPDKQLLDKIVWFLGHLKNDGVKVKEVTKQSHKNSSINHIKKLKGLGKELYQDISGDEYIKKLRDEW